MNLFSQRNKLKPVKTIIQIDSMDEDLQNGLWNALLLHYWNPEADYVSKFYSISSDTWVLLVSMWSNYYKNPLDTLDNNWNTTFNRLRSYFFSCTYNEVYDFIEFVANEHTDKVRNQRFMDYCNNILERELSAYRFVGGKITQITTKEEISEIEDALSASPKPVANHLGSALKFLSDKQSPNYSNSIKESISAVEAVCNLIAGKEKATLGDALKEISAKSKIDLHPALRNSFNQLYGYTSDAEGIRHALLEEPTLTFEDAKFMLVSCSAFINYLVTKAQKAGIKL